MGNNLSASQENCNYNCPVCKTSGKIPNIAGRFYIISDTECQCSGCGEIFEKKKYYRDVSLNLDEENHMKTKNTTEGECFNAVCFKIPPLNKTEINT